jgi:SAM-dependent methyltransferase
MPQPHVDDLTRPPLTDPSDIYRSRDELYATDMLIAAVTGLDFFTFFTGAAADARTIAEVARHFSFDTRAVDVMTTLFVAKGLLARDGERLLLTPVAREHLVSSSPWFLGPYLPRVADRPIAGDLLEILRTGQPANFASRKDERDWHRAMETEKVAEEFTAAMDCRGRLLAQALAANLDLGDRQRLLDIAGGSGIYACALAARFPELRATVLDKSPVDRIALRSIAARGFADRVDVVASDMLAAPLPAGYDAHLFSNVLHDWDIDVVRQLLAASSRALTSGGLLIVHDAYLDSDKSGPLSIASYSVLLMHVTQGRCYSILEMSEWMMEAGFARPTHVPSALGRSALIGHKH